MKADFFQLNRDRLITSLHGGVAVFSAYNAMQRGNDASFNFEQEANFWWLTGIQEPDWQLIIDGSRNKSWLVVPHVSDIHQIFDGSLSPENAKSASGVDGVIGQNEATDMIHDLSKKHSMVYCIGDHPAAEYFNFVVNPAQNKLRKVLERQFSDVQDCRLELSQLRAIKQPVEIAAIKKAIKLTNSAFENVKTKLKNLSYEYEVEAEFTYAFKKMGSAGHAYDPIIASGKNACTLHYGANNMRFKNNTLLLMDIGARVDGYAADITRTYSIGIPTKRQIEVHQMVEQAHKKIINLIKPGLDIQEYDKSVDVIMQYALDQLGLIKSPDDYRRYFPHAISHGLGVDVHDSLGRPSYLQAGMVLTVEPGIYIPEEGIGVRIEDDILVTERGHINLSASLSTSL